MRRFAAMVAVLLAALAPTPPARAAEDMGPRKAGDLAGQCVVREAARLTGGTQADAGTVAATVCRICQPDFASFAEAFAREESRAGRAVDRPALDASVVQLCLKRAATYAEKGIATRKELERTYGAKPGSALAAKPGPDGKPVDSNTAKAPAKVGPAAKANPGAKANSPATKPAIAVKPVSKPVPVAKPAGKANAKAPAQPAAKAKPGAKTKPAASPPPGAGSGTGAKVKPKPKTAPGSPSRPPGQT